MPQPDRCHSGYVLEIGGRLFQFDCGGGVSRAFRKAGFDSLNVERIVISHTHPDHISDLPLFIQMQYLAGRQDPITIHLPEEAIEPIRAQFQAMYLLEHKMPFELSFAAVSEGRPIESGEVMIETIANSHLEKYAPFVKEYDLPNRQQCYSFLISAGGKKILYSADLGSEKDILGYLDDLDLLVIESTHIDIGNLLERSAQKNIGRIVLTHIEEGYDVDQAVQIAWKQGADNLIIAQDGMRIEL